MKEFFDKVESYLFDFLGLFIPGLLSVILLLIPISFLNIDRLLDDNYFQAKLLTLIVIIKQSFQHINILNDTYIIIIIILILYVLGHLIKVFSIIFYEIGTVIFDNTLIRAYKNIFYRILNPLKRYYVNRHGENERVMRISRTIYNYLKMIYQQFKKNLFKVLVFKPEDYMLENEELKNNCLNIINEKLKVNFPNVSYSIYKISMIINTQENIKSLSYTFLSKYNLYRSLSFLFFVSLIYFYYFFNVAQKYIYPEVLALEVVVLILIGLLWFTFHHKYKRYWTLCGNETLMSLFYFLNKNKLNAG